MLDIIIPTYKNKEGLRQTLSSINRALLPNITVTIIDDCSDIYYNDILEEFPFTQIFCLQKNSGPGNARAFGISVTNEPYIMFLDTEDYFISNEIQQKIIDQIILYPNQAWYFWQYKSNTKISNKINNLLHGKIYSRDFITKYNIHFCPTSSFANEDIGFNRLYRIIIQDKQLNALYFEEPIIELKYNDNSITHINNDAFFYEKQNIALARVSIWNYSILKNNNISDEAILKEMNTIMAALYYGFICTIHVRPEYTQESWNGAKNFYEKIFIYLKNTNDKIQEGYEPYIHQIFKKKRKWKRSYPINYNRFLNDLSKYEKVPYWYLEFKER